MALVIYADGIICRIVANSIGENYTDKQLMVDHFPRKGEMVFRVDVKAPLKTLGPAGVADLQRQLDESRGLNG